MPYFPQLNPAGLIAHRPYAATQASLTTHEDQPTGRRYAHAWRTDPLMRWPLTWQNLSDAELAVLEAFFDQAQGRFAQFTFLDPGGNLVEYSEDFSQTAWEKYTATPGAAAADPFGGNRATVVTGSSSNSMLAAYVLPDGNASGFVLCGSLYVLSAAASSLHIGFIDSGFTVLGGTTWTLPAGQWTRIRHSITLATALPVRLLIGGLGTWGATSLTLFGAQCAPMPGPGAYQRSPANWGLHPNCRFDSDALSIRLAGHNQNTVSLTIAEYKS